MIIKRNRQKNVPNPRMQELKPVSPDVVVEKTEVDTQSASSVVDDNVETNTLVSEEVVEKPEESNDIFSGFNFDTLDFPQRAERRRGDRRRGYRRSDDRNMISRAQAEAIRIKEEAAKEGYDQGLIEARSAIDELKSSISEFLNYKETVYNEISNDILDISLKVAEKIIKKEISRDKTILDGIITDALKSIAKDETKIILKVNPIDVEYTKEIIPNLLSTGQVEAKIYVTGIKDVEEGSVIIETSNGVIDANIRTQLNILKESFKQI